MITLKKPLFIICIITSFCVDFALAAENETELKFASLEASKLEYQRAVTPYLEKHCLSCHNDKRSKGDLNLKQLDPDMKASTSAARWAMLLEKVSKGEMPPKSKPRPNSKDTEQLIRWIHAEMKRAGKRIAHREEYINGNSVPHDLLFDTKQNAPFHVSPRVRRLSPEIYQSFTNEAGKGARGISQPFSPVGNQTFKDMGAPKVDEPITVTLLRNALSMVEKQTAHTIEKGEVKKKGFVAKEFLELFDPKSEPTEEQIHNAIRKQFEHVLRRKPTEKELARFTALMQKNINDSGRTTGVRYTLAAVYLLPEAVFRFEVGKGKADAKGRVRLSDREIVFALSYALTDRRPDSKLLAEIEKGTLSSREGVAKVVKQMLENPKIKKPRILRFFQEFFDYTKATEVFKDQKANSDHDARILIEDTTKLIEYILEQDKDVFRELLTTNKSFVGHRIAADLKKKRRDALKKFEEQKRKNPKKYKNKTPRKIGKSIYEAYNLKDFPDQQPIELPKSERAGILTQPAWLVAFSTSDDNHAILRGKWIRERLLGGVVPDIPITVDAQLPNKPEHTLRQRMKVTEENYCWQCHRLMNPVGLPFEQFDHYGRYREQELVLDPEATAKNVDKKGKTKGPVQRGVAVDASGRVDLVGEGKPKAEVKNALEMVRHLASSPYVEQVFVRHAFRYWMGRNETLGDGRSLQEVYRAYRENGGSMKALLIALLSSDSFLYRVPSTTTTKK